MEINIKSISTLNSKEIQQLTEIMRYAVQHSEGVTVDEAQIERFYEDIDRDMDKGHCIMAIAQLEGRIIGSVIAKFYTPATIRHLTNYEKLIVHPEFRRQGIALKLMTSLEGEVKKLGKEKIELSFLAGNPVQKVYEKLGYTIWGTATKVNKIGDEYFDEVYMEKLFI